MSLTGKLPILESGTGTIHHEKTDDEKKNPKRSPRDTKTATSTFQKTCLQPRSGEETGVWQLSQLKHEIKKEHSPAHVDEECAVAVSVR